MNYEELVEEFSKVIGKAENSMSWDEIYASFQEALRIWEENSLDYKK